MGAMTAKSISEGLIARLPLGIQQYDVESFQSALPEGSRP